MPDDGGHARRNAVMPILAIRRYHVIYYNFVQALNDAVHPGVESKQSA